MSNQNSHTIHGEADVMLDMAKEELCRPHEDIVHYNACKHAYKAIEKYMTAYLIQHGIHIHHSNHIKELLAQCQKLDSKFNEINYEPILNGAEPEKLMMNFHAAQTFVQLAEKTRDYVNQK